MEFIHFEAEIDSKEQCYADDEESDMDDNCSSEDDFFIDDRPLPKDNTPPMNPYLFPQRPSVWQSKFIQFVSSPHVHRSRSSKTDHLNKKQNQKQKQKQERKRQKRRQKKEPKQEEKKIRDKKTKLSSSNNPEADFCYDTDTLFINSHCAIDLRQGCDSNHAIVITDD